MDQNNIIECGGFFFIHKFDSGNLGHVERVPTELIASSLNAKSNVNETPDYEFNMWTRPDCAGTEFENGNRTWFYFGVQASVAGVLVRLNLINLNKQGKMYNQGMAPVTRTLPGKPQWERIRDRPIHSTDDNTFTLSFKYRTSENLKATTFFAFTYPFSFAELQIALNSIDYKMLPLPPMQSLDDIYYFRECLIYSLEGRRVDLLTLTSHHGITSDREDRLKHLFPDSHDRPHKFLNKKIIFVSARVHPGETPSSFVFNGFLNLLLTKSDPIAMQLRKLYVFKMVPFLNPDGVARGHYRTDTRGVNLNRVYLNPSLALHPTVYAARALIRYYHYGCEKEDVCDESSEIIAITPSKTPNPPKKKELTNTSLFNKSSESYKREVKPDKPERKKSATTIKPPTVTVTDKKEKHSKGEAATLIDQVYDLKLQERSSQISATSSKFDVNIERSPSLLNDAMLRNCLGSTVHLSTSEELNFHGQNPLRSLRDTLKNSISLLMESTSSVACDSVLGIKDSKMSGVKMDWCTDCKNSSLNTDSSQTQLPGMANYVTEDMTELQKATFHTIEEYREHQKKLGEQYHQGEMTADQVSDKEIHFCTNCFKKYIISEQNDEIVIVPRKVCTAVSTTSVGVSAGDSGDLRGTDTTTTRLAGSTGDVLLVTRPPTSKEDKQPKSAPPRQDKNKKKAPPPVVQKLSSPQKEPESGLYLYIDLHGHASKKGIFMYGNHFEDLESCVECMLLPRIMSLNNLHFHFSSCNFTERNMYLKDRRDGMSREGSGRVAVLKATGLVRSYTLECNYNTGRLVNVLPPTVSEGGMPPPTSSQIPPKYTPHIFEEVGRSLGASILDLTNQHPNSRLPCSEHRNLSSVRDWLRAHTRTMRPQLTMSRLRPKPSSPPRVPVYNRSKAKVTEERKENTYIGVKTEPKRARSPVLAPRSGHEIVNMNMKFGKKNEPVKTPSRTRYLTENEPKPKTLSSKRRNVLSIRKPNSSKSTLTGGVVKAKTSRRSVDDNEGARHTIISTKLSKQGFARTIRSSSTRTHNRCRAMASSSSDDMLGSNWEDVAGGTALAHGSRHSAGGKRRPFANSSPSHLKKIRLKSGM